MSETNHVVRSARIFDRGQSTGDTTLTGRAEKCWRWAEQQGLDVVEEHVAWGASAELPKPPELVEAVEHCAVECSTLIVYSIGVISDDPDVIDWVRREMGPLPISEVVASKDGAK